MDFTHLAAAVAHSQLKGGKQFFNTSPAKEDLKLSPSSAGQEEMRAVSWDVAETR